MGVRLPPRAPADQGRFRTKKDAERALGETLRSLDEGTHVARDPQTLGEWIERWLETMMPKVRASTLRDYRNGLKRVSDRLGSVQLQALRPLDLETRSGSGWCPATSPRW